jgi:DNA-binding response OmpR family regulator
VTSEPGHGTTFRVYLPITDAVASVVSEIPRTALVGTETLLIIEDDEPLRTAISRMLAPRGYRLLVATCGAEALELAAHHKGAIDLVLTDVIMPGISGPDIVERLRDVVGPVRTLFMSGYTDHAVLRSETFNASVNFIQKPFAPEGLVVKVRAVLDGGVSTSGPDRL